LVFPTGGNMTTFILSTLAALHLPFAPLMKKVFGHLPTSNVVKRCGHARYEGYDTENTAIDGEIDRWREGNELNCLNYRGGSIQPQTENRLWK